MSHCREVMDWSFMLLISSVRGFFDYVDEGGVEFLLDAILARCFIFWCMFDACSYLLDGDRGVEEFDLLWCWLSV